MTAPIRTPFDNDPTPPRAPELKTPFDDDFVGPSPTARVRALVNGVQHSPDQAAEAVTLSKRMGVPADVALRNLDPLRQMASIEEFDADTFVRENPATSRWLQGDPIRPALAKDDFESLTGLERIFGRGGLPSLDDFGAAFAGAQTAGFRNPVSPPPSGQGRYTMQRGTVQAAFQSGTAQIEETELYGRFRTEERRNPAVQAQIAAARARQVALPEPTGLFEESLRSAASGFLPSMLFVSGAALEGWVVGGASGAALGAIGGPAAGLTAGVGATAGAKLAGYNAYRLLMTGELAKSLEEARDANNQPIPDEIQDRVALAGGAGLALLGMYGFDKAVGILGRGTTAVASRVIANGVAKSLTTRTAARVGLDVALVYGGSVAFETAQEVTEQAGIIAAESIAREVANAQGMEFDPVDNVLAELGETAVQTALGALWFGGVGAVGAGAVGMARVQKATEDGAQLAEAIGIADASKLRQRDPEAFESVVAEQVRGSGKENLSVDGERLQILLQEQGVPLETFAAEMGLDVKDFASRIAQGGDVMLPTAKVLARLTGTDLITPMADILKWRPDGLAPVEAREQAALIEKEGAAIRKMLEEEIEVAKGSPEERIIDSYTAQVMAAAVGLPKKADFTEANVRDAALVAAKFYRIAAMAEGRGRDAFQLYQEAAPRFLTPEVSAPIYAVLDELKTLRDEKQTKQTKKVQARIRVLEAEAQRLLGEAGVTERMAELRATIAAAIGEDVLENKKRIYVALKATGFTDDATASSVVKWQEKANAAGVPMVVWRSGTGTLGIVPQGQRSPFRGGEIVGTLFPETNADVLEQAAFHGTPYTFDRFDLSKIGTGEGAQAYGWGLYFAQLMNIAEGYRKTLSGSVVKSADGTPLAGVLAGDADALKILAEAEQDTDLNLREYATYLRTSARTSREYAALGSAPDANLQYAEAAEKVAALFEGGAVAEKSGNLYQVDIPDEAVARMLDWDKPLSEQAPEVLKALQSVDAPIIQEMLQPMELGNTYGSALYWAMGGAFGGQRAASEALLAAGIPGIKYLDAGSRVPKPIVVPVIRISDDVMVQERVFATRAEADAFVATLPDFMRAGEIRDETTRNLVVFDENLVTITHRNGEPVTAQERTDFLAQEAGTRTAFTPEQEVAYAEATAKRDKREARKIVEAVLGYEPKDWGVNDYQGAHTPAGPGSGAPAFDLTDIYPDDVYSSNAVRYYGTGDEQLDRAAFSVVMGLRDNPKAEVKIYRAVPKDSPQTKINGGDWVTTVRAYAKDHGEGALRGDYRIISKTVKARDIYTSGDSMAEWGYHPQDRAIPAIAYKGPSDARVPLTLAEMVKRYGEPDMLAQSPSLPETLDIDGVARPTRNSTGQPIHPTEEGVRNFWRWFGDSKVVDAEGRPLVVYHGTQAEQFGEFRPRSYFSVESAEASAYTGAGEMQQAARQRKRYKKVQANGSLDGMRVPYTGIFSDADPEQSDVWATDQGVVRFNGKVREVFSDVVINTDTFDDGFNTVELMTEETDDADVVLAEVEDWIARNLGEVPKASGTVYPVYLRITNPKELSVFEGNRLSPRIVTAQEADALAEQIRSEGFDGVITESDDAAFYQGRSVTQYVALNGESVKSALGNSGEFGPTANILRQGANAFIIPGVSQRTIGLMPTANLSSVLHEMAHDFLFVYRDLAAAPDASPKVKAFYADMLAAVDVKDGVLTEAAQEKFARGFERRLQDGKAPSRALMRAYVRFQSWMTRIYRMMTEKLVPISPELRDVFDRMVATEEELAEVRGEIGAEPMFSDAEAELLGEEAVARYQAKVELRTAEEQGTLLKRLLAERSDEYRKVKAEREKVIRAEVEAEVAERPVYRALRSVTGKDAPKLDLADLEAQFGDGVRSTLPKAITASEGNLIPVDAVALQFGFRDGTALVASLQDARVNTEKREVATIVAQRMREEFPDPMESSVVMRDEAQKAAHVGETDDVLLDELKFLGKLAGIRPRGNQAVTLEAVRKVARDTMAKERVRDIRPVVYANAEARAATKSGQAMKKGDYAEAEKYKRQQMVQHILYREAVKALEMAEKVRKFASRMDKTPAQERLGKAGKAYQDAMNALLDAYEFRDLSRPQMAQAERVRAMVAAWAEEVALAYTVETDDGKVSVIQPEVSEALLASPMNYRELSAGRVQELYDAMKQVYHTATALDKEMRAKKAMLFSERVELLVDTAEINWTPDKPKFIQSQGRMDKLADDLDAKHGEMIKVEMLARMLDGDKPNGPWQEALTNYAAESQAEFNRDMEQFTARYKAAMNLIPKDRIKGFFTQLVNVPNVAGQGTENTRMTGQQVFHLLLNYGNESSRAAVNAGEFSNGYHPYSDANAKKLFALLTPEEMQAAQEIWDAVSMFWDQIAEMNREMTGITPKKVPALPVTLLAADGSEVTLKGGYFPLKYDTRFSAKAYQQEQTRAEATAQGLVPFLGSATSSTERGHLIERQDANGRIVDLSAEVVARHMSASVYDLTHRRMVYDVQKLVLDPRIADIVQRTAGKGAYRKALLPWARRLAGEKGPPQTWVAKMALRARAGASTMGLGFRATTIMLQYLGLGQVAALIGPKYTARGFREIQKYKKGAFEAADALAPEIAYRQLSFNRDLTEMARTMKAKGTWNEVYEIAFAGIAFMDRQVSVAGFWGGYYQWLDANPTDVAGAVQAGEQAVRLSQGANNAKDLAQLMASNDPLTRTLTSFFSNGSVLYQLFWRGSRQLKGKGKEAKVAFLTTLLGAWILPTVLEPLMRGSEPDDKDPIEDKIAWWFWQISSYPMQAIPLARDLARMLEPGSKFGKEFAPPFLRPFTELGKSAIAVADIAGDGELDAKDIKQFVKTIGYWSNLPLDAPWGMSERLYQWMTGEVAPDNVLEGGRFVLTNAPIR